MRRKAAWAISCLALVLTLYTPLVAAETSSHPITLRDILALREISEQRISPDGRTVAFVVKDANVDANSYTASLYIVAADGKSGPKLLLKDKSISNLRWMPAGDALTYIGSADKLSQIMQLGLKSAKPEALFKHAENVTSFEWSPDGKTVAVISVPPIKDSETAKASENGILFDTRDYYPIWTFIERGWVKKPTAIWLYRPHEKQLKRLWQQNASLYHFEKYSISKLVWAPDGKKFAVEYQTSASTSKNGSVAFNSGIGILTADTGEFKAIPSTESFQVSPSWSPDGSSLAFIAEVETQTPRSGFREDLFVYDVGSQNPPRAVTEDEVKYGSPVWWSKDKRKFIIGMETKERAALYELPSAGGSLVQVSKGEDHLSEFSLSSDLSTASLVVQGPMKAPEIGVMKVGSGTVKQLTHINAAYDHIQLGQVSQIKWKNKFGYETNGYLIKPIGYQEGKRYPLLVILYGFHGRFITQAEWIASYPAQVFAANGFAVLMMNQPKEYGWHYGNFEEFSFDRDYNPMASIEAAVEHLTETGLADPKRTGMLGWSYGSELTNLMLTHRKVFAAGSSSSGAAYNSGEYWITGDPFRHYLDGVMGGTAYGKHDPRYDELSTAGHVGDLSVPLLIQTPVQEMLWSLEFYTAAKTQGKPVEMVVYPDEGHIYSQPKHRLASMQVNLDWFQFWLQGYEDAKPEKQDQYQRWKALLKTDVATN